MREFSQLPADLVKLLMGIGSRKLVLLEGNSDYTIFHIWFVGRQESVTFHTLNEGKTGVKKRLEQIGKDPNWVKQVFGIIDRDFCSDQEIDTALLNSDARLYLLRRYAIENYLLEPNAIFNVLAMFGAPGSSVPDTSIIERELLNLCQKLHSMMAANWMISETGLEEAEYFPNGHDLIGRDEVIAKIVGDLGCTQSEAEQRLQEKENTILPLLVSLETAYTRINGKHVLHHIFRNSKIVKMSKDVFIRTLAGAVRDNPGLHSDIKTIIEERILA